MKKIIFIVIIILATLSIVNSIQAIYSLWMKREVITTASKELAKEQEKNKQLKAALNAASGQEFVEEEARNKLFMVKPGENTVIIPKEMLATESAQKQVETNKSNWQQWFSLFF